MAQKLVTAAQMRELDRRAMCECGIPSDLLMESAARAVATAAMSSVVPAQKSVFKASVFCGPGNNGGDGVAAARFLLQAGFLVQVLLVGSREKMTPDCREMERRLEAAGGKLVSFIDGNPYIVTWCMEADVIVDALFGVGLNAPLRGDALAAARLMNASPAPTVSADVPSGVGADTGEVPVGAVRADKTVTFTFAKPGLWVGKGALRAGEVVTAPIGIPERLTHAVACDTYLVQREDARLPRRPRDGHKGTFGRVYLIAGSVGYTGAPVLAARAAVRARAGLVFLGVPREIYPIVAVKCDEAMPAPLPEEYGPILERAAGCDAVLAGPGLGRGPWVGGLIGQLLEGVQGPLILDADGINELTAHIDGLDGRAARGRLTVLTPHDGELARLLGRPCGADRISEARGFAAAHGVVLVLKGHRTVTAFPDGTVYINPTGNPGMARGGSGDALAGIITAFLGQGLEPKRAVPAAVYLHGAAGDLCAAERGEYGMTVGELIEALPRVMEIE